MGTIPQWCYIRMGRFENSVTGTEIDGKFHDAKGKDHKGASQNIIDGRIPQKQMATPV